MSEDTLWELQPHTKAKHDILNNYLAAWFPILSSFADRILYIDGFAGPGSYSGGELGSPVHAIRTAYDHMLRDKFKEIVFLFIEKRQDRAEHLRKVLEKEFPNLPNEKMRYYVVTDEFERALDSALSSLESNDRKMAPTFAFIDPFGYAGFSMDILERILRNPSCEVFITFMSGFIKRFLDEGKADVLTELFKTTEWKAIKDSKDPKDQQVLDLFLKQLDICCEVEHVKSFKMINKFNQPIYHLVFCTNSLKGLEIMKKSMWNMDKTGEFKFADTWDERQSFLFDYSDQNHWIPRAAKMVCSEFRGRTATVEDIYEYVIAETPFLFYKSILKHIDYEMEGALLDIQLHRKRKRGTYPDGTQLIFNP